MGKLRYGRVNTSAPPPALPDENNLFGWPLTLSSEEFVEVLVAPKPVSGMELITCTGGPKPVTHTSCVARGPSCHVGSRLCPSKGAARAKPVTMLPWCSPGLLKPPRRVEQPPALPPGHVSGPPPGDVLPVPFADPLVASCAHLHVLPNPSAMRAPYAWLSVRTL